MVNKASWPLHLCYTPWFQESVRTTSYYLFKVFYKTSLEGLDNTRADGPTIVAPNHTRWSDHLLCGTPLPLHFGMGKVAYFTPAPPGSSWAMRELAHLKMLAMREHGMYPVKRSRDTSPEAVAYTYECYIKPKHHETILKHVQRTLPKDNVDKLSLLNGPTFTRYLLMMGELLMWFPQGTRHPEGDAGGARPGLGQVVLDLARDYEVKTVVVPTAILYEKVGGMRPWPPTSGLRGRVRYDRPLEYDDLLEEYVELKPEKDSPERRRIQQRFSDRVMERVGRMLSEMRDSSALSQKFCQ